MRRQPQVKPRVGLGPELQVKLNEIGEEAEVLLSKSKDLLVRLDGDLSPELVPRVTEEEPELPSRLEKVKEILDKLQDVNGKLTRVGELL